MTGSADTPRALAERMAMRLSAEGRQRAIRADGFIREDFALTREAARDKAREWFDRFPKAAYMTEVERWSELPDGRIAFTLRRLKSAD